MTLTERLAAKWKHNDLGMLDEFGKDTKVARWWLNAIADELTDEAAGKSCGNHVAQWLRREASE